MPSSSFARQLYEAAALPADQRHVRIGELTRQGMGADAVMESGPLKALLEDLAARIDFKKLGKPANLSAWASATSKKALRSLSKRLKPLRERPSHGHSALARGSTSDESAIEFSELNETKARRTLRRGVDYERALHFLRRHQHGALVAVEHRQGLAALDQRRQPAFSR